MFLHEGDARGREAGGRCGGPPRAPARAAARAGEARTPTLVAAVAALCAAVAAPVAAQSSTSAPVPGPSLVPDLAFSGFGTLGYAALDDPGAEYRTGEARDGADEDGSFEVDSRLGLQLDATFSRRWSATLQGVARQDETGDAGAVLEWGFLRWLPTDTLAVRAGRMSLPVFAVSDYREVGYANLLLRPIEDVYSLIPLRRFDGVDVTLDTELGGALVRWQALYGQARDRIFDDLEPDARDSLGLSVGVERGPVRVRLSHVQSRLDIDSDNADVAAVRAGIERAQALVPELAAVADDFAGERVPLRFDAIGVSLDFGRVFADLEYAQRRIDNWVPDSDGASLMVGARIGPVRPYGFVSAVTETDGDRRVELPDGAGLDALEAGIDAFYQPRDQRTIGLGARWDASANFALKGQVERISRDVLGISFLRNDSNDGSDAGDDVTLVSVALDFIF